MKKIVLPALLLASMVFINNASADEMKCGAGKCGASMKMKACPAACTNPKCAHKLDASKKCDCNVTGKMKCGASMMEKPAMKKCGSK